MNEQAFVEKREKDWQKLTRLCDRADVGARRLSPAEVRELVTLYRRASTDLSTAQTKSTNLMLIDYLNDLVGRAYATLYRAPRPGILQALYEALTIAAQTVRRQRWVIAISAIFFFGTAVFTGLAIDIFPNTHDVLVPRGDRNFEAWKSGALDERDTNQSFEMSGFYAMNNPRVAVITGAVGAGSFGFLSLYFLYMSGSQMGALGHEMASVGRLDFLLSSIFPHGVPELSGAIIAGSAGLVLAWALINPGRRSRAYALKAVGKDAVTLLVTSVILMFIAAPIEGFFSFNPHVPGAVKVAVGTIELIAWLTFWSMFGRTDEEMAARHPAALTS